MVKIPSKQLHRAGLLADLQQNLSDREIGYCPDNGVLYIKYGELVPIGVAVTSGDGIHVDVHDGLATVSLAEQNAYVAGGSQTAYGVITITKGSSGNPPTLVSLGNVPNIGSLVPVPESGSNGSNGKFLKVISNGGNFSWVALAATDIPDLDASKITSGMLAVDTLPIITSNGITAKTVDNKLSIERDPVQGNFGKGDYSGTKYLTIGSGDKKIALNITRDMDGSAIVGIRITVLTNITENAWFSGATDFTMECTGHAAESYSYTDTVTSVSGIRQSTVGSMPIACIFNFYSSDNAPEMFNVSAKGYIYFVKSDVKYMAEFEFILKSYGSDTNCVYVGSGDLRVLTDMT